MDERWLLLGLGLVLAGCGSDDDSGGSGGFPSGTTCGVSIALSGGVEQTVGASDSVACATQLSSTSGVDIVYLPLADGALDSVNVIVSDVEKGKTGKGFPAEVRVQGADGTNWHAIDCAADVSENAFDTTDDFADQYRTSGTGSCSGPATSGSGKPDISVGAFTFVAVVPWTKS